MTKISGWKKGFIEASLDTEAWLGMTRYKRKGRNWYNYAVGVSVANTCREFLEILNDTTENLGFISPQKYGDKKHKTCYRLYFSMYALRKLLPKIGLIIKEENRLLMLEALNILKYERECRRGRPVIPEGRKRLDEIYFRLKELNAHGENLWR